MEWWFVQGRYEADARLRHFMAALLLKRGSSGRRAPDAAASLLLAVLDPSAGRHEYLSRVNHSAVALVQASAAEVAATGVDDTLLRAYVEELDADGPPRPIQVAAGSPRVLGAPLRLSWNDFSLAQDRSGLRLAFREPGAGASVRLNLSAADPPAHLGRLAGFDGPAMDYSVCPRLHVRGRVGGRPATGQAWFEHQWGAAGWLLDRRSGSLVGWTWFGICLPRDERLLLFELRDLRQPRRRKRWAALMARGARTPRWVSFRATPARRWESPRTHIVYPIEWDITVPALDARLRFEPLVADQEIAVLGAGRAIWEGSGRVTGTIRGRAVNEHARLELQGHGYWFEPHTLERRLVARIDRSIESYLPRTASARTLRAYGSRGRWKHEHEAYTRGLCRPIWDLLERGGRRWRPVFGLLMLDALGVRSDLYDTLVSLLSEVPHTAALIVDDIEDGSEVRRGAQCVHLRYGTDVALNAANTAYFLPYTLLARHPHLDGDQRLDLYRILSVQTLRAHLGQAADLYWSRHITPDRLRAWLDDSIVPKVLQAYAYKTGAVAEGMAGAACVIARADRTTRARCEAFGRTVGVAYQIVDDVLGYTDASALRKLDGEDMTEGKLTYVVLRALERLPPAGARRLGAILASKTARQDGAAVAEGIDLVCRSGAPAACQEEAERMLAGAWARVRRVIPPSEPRVLLNALCTGLLSR